MSNTSNTSSKPEKVIVHIAYPILRKQSLLAMARAQELRAAGNTVVVTYCDSSAGTCAVNHLGNPATCALCQKRTRSTAKGLGFKTVPLGMASEAEATPHAVSLVQKKQLLEGVQSDITSTFRVLPSDGNSSRVLNWIKRRYFSTALRQLAAMQRVIARENVDRVEVFNGRHACSRFCISAALGMGIKFNTFEIVGRHRPIVFEGHTAHDRHAVQKRMLSHPADEQLANEFFANRRRPRFNKFAKQHATEYQPPSAEGFEKKVTVFLSSQDECEALGRDWRSAFSNYPQTILELCKANPKTLFCVRFHPNQADITTDIITPFQEVAGQPNAIVYYPKDTANTYKLVEWSDTVVTFGSTVTVEACWMEKPVILLGPSFYDSLDVAYTPKSIVRPMRCCNKRSKSVIE